MKRKCELCGDRATMYCESDAASLCLRCDEQVHGANFLVAKHERSLLCSVCQAVTSWKASGPRLGRTVSVCDGCFCDRSGGGGKLELKADPAEAEEVESRDDNSGGGESDASSDGEEEEEEEEYEDEEEEEEEDDDEDEEEEEEEIEEDDDEENQVVPWSSGEDVSSSSNGGGETNRKLKRRRDSSDLDFDEETEIGGGSSSTTAQPDHATTWRLMRSTRYPSLSELTPIQPANPNPGKSPKISG